MRVQYTRREKCISVSDRITESTDPRPNVIYENVHELRVRVRHTKYPDAHKVRK